MTEVIVQARPRSVAVAAALPVLVAVAAFGNRSLFALALLVAISMFYGWCWAVGEALLERTAPAGRRATATFRLAVAFCAVYAAAFVLNTAGLVALPRGQSPALFAGLHLLAVLATLGIVRFIAGHLAAAEAAANLESRSTARTFLQLSSVAGLLPVQRRLNRLFGGAAGDAGRAP